ncbi:MAG: CRISPR-associated protein Cas4 [Candidatus Brocadiia bacterium]
MQQQEHVPEPTVLISMLQHYVYCPRQWALIHIERAFEENVHTLGGRRAHRNVHQRRDETRDGVRIAHSLPLWSEPLGLRGQADVVEFRADGPYPVEYKHGKRTDRDADNVQLCAQALCLEEMLRQDVPRGAVYHHSSRARREVEFTPELRRYTREVICQVRRALCTNATPRPPADRRCRRCAQRRRCLPETTARAPDIRRYLANLCQPDPLSGKD